MAINPEDYGVLQDPEFVNFVSQKMGLQPKPQDEEGGFFKSAKQVTGSTIKGLGQFAADVLPGVSQDNGLKRYGQSVVDANQTKVHSFEDFGDNPWTGVREVVGNAAAPMGIAAGVTGLGTAISAIPTLPTQIVGRGLQGIGALATFAAPSYGGIRDKQIADNPDAVDSFGAKAAALGGAATVGAIEQRFGPQQWASNMMSKAGREALAKQFAAGSLKGAIGKGALRGAAIEGAEELVQNPVEQLASFDNPLTAENLKETAFSGFMGAVGGGVLGGGFGGLSYRKPQAPGVKPDVNDTNTPFNVLDTQQGPGLQGSLFDDDGTGHFSPLSGPVPEGNADVLARREEVIGDRAEVASYIEQMMQSGNYEAARAQLPLLERIDKQLGGINSMLTDDNGLVEGRTQANPNQMGFDFAGDRNTPLDILKFWSGTQEGQTKDMFGERATLPDSTDLNASEESQPDLYGTPGIRQGRLDFDAPVTPETMYANPYGQGGLFTNDTLLGASGKQEKGPFWGEGAHGQSPITVGSPLIQQMESGQYTPTAPPNFKAAKGASANPNAPAAKQVKPASKKAQAFEAQLAAAVQANPDDEVVRSVATRWEASKKTNTVVSELSKDLNVAGPNTQLETSEARLQREAAEAKMTDEERLQNGFVKQITYSKDADGKQVEQVQWVKPKEKRVTEAAKAEAERVDPDDIQDPTHEKAVRMHLAGDSTRAIAGALGQSHETWRKVLLGYGYDAKSKVEEDAAEAETGSAFTADASDTVDTPDVDANPDITDNDEYVDHELENQGITIRKTGSNSVFGKDRVSTETKLERAEREADEAQRLAEDQKVTDEAVAKILEGDFSSAASLLVALSGPNHKLLVRRLVDNFGVPKTLQEPKAIVEYFAGKQADAETSVLEAARGKAVEILGERFNSLSPEDQLYFATYINDLGDNVYSPNITRQIKGEFNAKLTSGQGAETADAVAEGTAESLSDTGRDDARTGEGETSPSRTPEVRVRKKRTVVKDEEGTRLNRRETLNFTDSTGKAFVEEVEWLDESQYPDVTDALDAVEDGPFAGVLDKVEGFYVSANNEAYAFKNPDGSFKVVLPQNALSGHQPVLLDIVHHELAHVADDADAIKGGVNSSGAVMGVMAIKAKALYDRLPANSALKKHLDYPFNNKYPESKSAKLLRVEIYAQLAAARLNPELAAELKAVSPALYNFAETIVNEIQEQYPAQTEAAAESTGVRHAEGTYSGAAPVFSRQASQGAGATQEGIGQAARAYAGQISGKSGEQIVDDVSNILKKSAYSLGSLHDLVEEFNGKLKSAKKWYESVQATIATRKQLESDAEKIAFEASKLKNGTQKVNEFISKSTFEQKWGYDATFKRQDGTTRTVKADPQMANEFRKLSPEEQKVAKDVFAHGEKMADTRFTLMKELGLSGEFTKSGKLGGPYAPLKRFGNFVGLLKSKELIAAEKADDKKRVAELKADPSHYMVSYFDTKGQAMQFAQANKDKWAFTDAFEGSPRVAEGRTISPEVLQKVLSAARMNDNIDPTARAAYTKMVTDMYIQTMDEHSARMSGLKRLNRAGYDSDMLRSFLSHARAEAGFLANMKHGGETNDQFYKMQQDAKGEGGKRVAQDEFNVLAKHYAENLKYEETPWQDRAMALTSAWQLSTSIGYHLVNAMQGIMVTVPKLAADFNNYSGAWSALMDGYKTLGKSGWKGGAFDASKITDKGLREALQRASDMGVLDIGMEEDLTHFEALRTGYGVIDKSSKVARSALHLLRTASRNVETMNRVSSATAGYRMMLAKTGDVKQAQDYAIRILQTTQGDFSRVGAPLLLKKLPKAMTQYRKYQFMMGALYVKAFRDAFMGANDETKAIGRRMLGFKLAHTAFAAGALGMPLMNLAALVFSALGGDDEPENLERSLREMIGDETLANLLLHGVPAMGGLDMSAKLGDDKIFSIMPYGKWDFSSAQGLKDTVFSLAGPATSQAGKMADGVGFMAKGDYYKGIEKLMPSGVSNGMKAFRIANEGYTLKNGDVMVKPEDINGFALALDAIGMPSSELKRMDWIRSQQYEIKRFYIDQSKELQQDYVKAYKDKDAGAMAELRQDWLDLQKGKDHMRQYFDDQSSELKRQPLSTLMKAPQNTANRERKLQRSVPD